MLKAQEGYTADLYADEAIAWLQKQDSATPFFLYLSMAEPHTTFENPAAYNQMYADYTDGEIVPIPSGLDRIPTETLKPRGPGEYYANITYMDAQLGRVLAELEHSGAKESTIIVFTSDNGPVTSQWLQWFEVNAHGSTGGYRGRKHFLYEGGIKVPAIISYPGVIESGSSSDQPLVGMDFFVTLANLGKAIESATQRFSYCRTKKPAASSQPCLMPLRPLLRRANRSSQMARRQASITICGCTQKMISTKWCLKTPSVRLQIPQ